MSVSLSFHLCLSPHNVCLSSFLSLPLLSLALLFALSFSRHFHNSLFLFLLSLFKALSLSLQSSFLNSLTKFTRSVGSLSLYANVMANYSHHEERICMRVAVVLSVCCGVAVVVLLLWCGLWCGLVRGFLVTPVVCPRVFEILTTLTFGAYQKTKNNETSSSTSMCHEVSRTQPK